MREVEEVLMNVSPRAERDAKEILVNLPTQANREVYELFSEPLTYSEARG